MLAMAPDSSGALICQVDGSGGNAACVPRTQPLREATSAPARQGDRKPRSIDQGAMPARRPERAGVVVTRVNRPSVHGRSLPEATQPFRRASYAAGAACLPCGRFARRRADLVFVRSRRLAVRASVTELGRLACAGSGIARHVRVGPTAAPPSSPPLDRTGRLGDPPRVQIPPVLPRVDVRRERIVLLDRLPSRFRSTRARRASGRTSHRLPTGIPTISVARQPPESPIGTGAAAESERRGRSSAPGDVRRSRVVG